MHTLEQLRRGELAGISRLDLAEDLDAFPPEIFDLADSLEILNLSGNKLATLPDDLPRLRNLRILFCSHNAFTELPKVVGSCSTLQMVGFKANRIHTLSGEALPPQLRWLTLTDNCLEALPDEIGRCSQLQKLLLAGNQLQVLPDSLAACRGLELLRISANRLKALPDWLLEMPRLSWLAFGGNPFSDEQEEEVLKQHPLPPVDRAQVKLGEQLGQGASGIIYRAEWQHPTQGKRAVAAKLFKGSLTSDGLPHSEMAASIAAGRHPSLVSVFGPLANCEDGLPGLLMALIEPSYAALAGPPSFASCSRDCYAPDRRFNAVQVLRISSAVAAAVAHLHARGILHGDVYAHNLLADPDGQSLLSDFGAASFFDPDSALAKSLQRIEARAFGCLLEELLERCELTGTDARLRLLSDLKDRCLQEAVQQRPGFGELIEVFNRIAAMRTDSAG